MLGCILGLLRLCQQAGHQITKIMADPEFDPVIEKLNAEGVEVEA